MFVKRADNSYEVKDNDERSQKTQIPTFSYRIFSCIVAQFRLNCEEYLSVDNLFWEIV